MYIFWIYFLIKKTKGTEGVAVEVPLRSPRAGVRPCDDQRSWQALLCPNAWEALGSFISSMEEHWPVLRPWTGCWRSGGQSDPSAPYLGSPSEQTRGSWKGKHGSVSCRFPTLLGSVGFGVRPAGPVLSLHLLLCSPGLAASPPLASAHHL